MKVKANWPVDTGDKVYPTGAKFDVSDDEAEQLERSGAVEILDRKKVAAKDSESESGEGGEGGEGGGTEPQS
ncbi:hypothetical protein K2O51_23360 [Cupriavidus pinatubonensis]|uniref:hypothetical protein n=1 Tax=Cupriavidus pinatubonensis TaxID=248026 RepID=UPI001C7325A0|nr:hypothetical protein [Cupriavidus pinatubonensis]QYY30311.1 hypothetical protein K2O51_23360 [Cupriavidus pinatubonensis]